MNLFRFPCPLFIIALVVFAPASSALAAVVVVSPDTPPAPVIIYANAPPKTMGAAVELVDAIEKISGQRPELIEGVPSPLPERAIWVGYQPVLDRLLPDIDFDFDQPEQILIAAAGNHLVIAGRDRWNEETLIVEGRNFTIEGQQQEYGTANAVYTFMQDHLGVRWLWAGPAGEDFLETDTLVFEPFVYRYTPPVRMRSGAFRLSAPGDGRGNSHDFVRRQRVQLDSLKRPLRGHAFGDWWERFGESNPEYFALQPNGERGPFPMPGRHKMCQSNPALWEQWLKDVDAMLADDPELTVFSASPNDSWHRGHCTCSECTAWDSPDGETSRLLWEGLSMEYVSLSDRQVRFANTLAELLRERYPDRPDFRVYMHAYGDGYTRPPVDVQPADNVIISGVHNFLMRGDSTFDEWSGRYRGWGEVTENLMWRPNIAQGFNRQGWPQSPSQAIRCFEVLNEVGCMGLYFDTNWEHWATHAPIYYIYAQMAWDPSIDGKALLEDYYQRGFGPAADTIKAYWNLGEERFHGFFNDPNPHRKVTDFYDAAYFEQAQALLDRARAEVKNDRPAYTERIDFIQAGLDHTRLLADNVELMGRYTASRKKDQEAFDQLKANWNAIADIYETYPTAFNLTFVIGGTAEFVPDDETRRMLQQVRFGRPRR